MNGVAKSLIVPDNDVLAVQRLAHPAGNARLNDRAHIVLDPGFALVEVHALCELALSHQAHSDTGHNFIAARIGFIGFAIPMLVEGKTARVIMSQPNVRIQRRPELLRYAFLGAEHDFYGLVE